MPTSRERDSHTNDGPGMMWLLHHDGISLTPDDQVEVWRYLLMHLRRMSRADGLEETKGKAGREQVSHET